MARATYDDIAKVVKTESSDFIVCPPEAEDECLTIYPPESFHVDSGIDVWLEGNTAELWMDGDKLKKLKSIQDAEFVAREIVSELKRIEAAYVAMQ